MTLDKTLSGATSYPRIVAGHRNIHPAERVVEIDPVSQVNALSVSTNISKKLDNIPILTME